MTIPNVVKQPITAEQHKDDSKMATILIMTGWKYIATFGFTVAVYSRGNDRVAINKDTGRVLVKYTISCC